MLLCEFVIEIFIFDFIRDSYQGMKVVVIGDSRIKTRWGRVGVQLSLLCSFEIEALRQMSLRK